MALDPLTQAALIKGGSTLIGGLLGAGGKKKDRKHQIDMLKLQIAAAEKQQQARWAEQSKRMEGARQAIAPEQGFMPTYQSLREVNPMLQKFFGGQMQKLFGGADAFGLGDVFSTIEAPGYTGFEQEQAPLEKVVPKKDITPQRIPSYFEDRYFRGYREGRGQGGR